MRGVFSESRLTNTGEHYALCSTTFWDQYYFPSALISQAYSNRTANNTFTALYASYDMLYYSYELISGCSDTLVTTGITTKSVFGNLFTDFDFRILLGNVIHNVNGFMADLEAVVLFFTTQWLDPSQYRA